MSQYYFGISDYYSQSDILDKSSDNDCDCTGTLLIDKLEAEQEEELVVMSSELDLQSFEKLSDPLKQGFLVRERKSAVNQARGMLHMYIHAHIIIYFVMLYSCSPCMTLQLLQEKPFK